MKSKGRTIIILVECQKKALNAGRFVLNNIYTDADRIFLAQIYKIQGAGLFTMRNLSKILKDISMEDLTILKNELIEEFGIHPDKIHKLPIEGEITTELKEEFGNSNASVVIIGEDTKFFQHENPQKDISTIIEGTFSKSIFNVEKEISLFDDTETLNMTGNSDEIAEISKKYLKKLAKKYRLKIEYNPLKNKTHKSIIKEKILTKVI